MKARLKIYSTKLFDAIAEADGLLPTLKLIAFFLRFLPAPINPGCEVLEVNTASSLLASLDPNHGKVDLAFSRVLAALRPEAGRRTVPQHRHPKDAKGT
jgi:hypothetical protein